ncbi:MAG: magnesium chelatase subunit D [Aestuariivita sp.]|nr:magnesium chelatase subunit D [Aestuariivita sp.]
MSNASNLWRHAQLALACLTQDASLRGMIVHARPGPIRDAFLASIESQLGPCRRFHPTISDGQLFGDVDISQTLSTGKIVRLRGLLDDSQTLILAMAERTEVSLAVRLSQYLDIKPSAKLILVDESASENEKVPSSLADRLAFFVDLSGLAIHDITETETPDVNKSKIIDSNGVLTQANIGLDCNEQIFQLTNLAVDFGIDSLRAPLLALCCARAHAMVKGRKNIMQEDILIAAELVYSSRVTKIPNSDAQEEPELPHDSSAEKNEASDAQDFDLNEILINAVKAFLPPNLLDQIKNHSHQKSFLGSGTGERKKGNRRGRPLPPCPGRLDHRSRIDLFATMRAAIPWQPLRRYSSPDLSHFIIRKSDLRLKRFQEKSDRLLIFTVDASGSSAVSRLNEIKGAVELLLAEAYSRRDHVALIVFRGTKAETLLPPTRSLVQTRRRLAALPGGGGTPLASGLKQASALAILSRSKGLTPTIIVMTDGRANIALDGEVDRLRATSDSKKQASVLKLQNIPGLMIDTSNRPQPSLESLAAIIDAPYITLPRADAHRLNSTVSQALESA